MNYATEAEADVFLSHSAAWLALTSDEKQFNRDIATRWLNFTYEWIGCTSGDDEWPRVQCGTTTPALDLINGAEVDGVPESLKQAESYAALTNLTTPLFAVASSASSGNVIKKVVKSGDEAVETTYGEATTASGGVSDYSLINSMLYKIGTLRGATVGRCVDFI